MKAALTKKQMIEEMVSSRYQSPKKQYEREVEEEVLPNQVHFQLQRVFEEAAHREEKYLATITEQQKRMQQQAQKYLQSLREIKKEFTAFLGLRRTKGQEMWKSLAEERATKKQAVKLNSKEFSQRTRAEYEKKEGSKSQPQLECFMTCYYYTPFVLDYVRQSFPQQMMLTLRTLYPNSEQKTDIRVIKEEDLMDNVNCLIHRVPFQITTDRSEAIRFQFKVPCVQQAIVYYRLRQFQLELVDRRGMFVYAIAKISLNSLLFYENQPTQWQLKPIPFYCVLSGRKVGEMSIKLGNSLQLLDRNEHYKIQSTTPIQVNNLKGMVNYNDDQSRLIQRISKFKTTNNSLLMGIGSSPTQGKAERFFQSENEKIVLMHRHKKELQTIQEYKNSHKQELMGKIFNEAIDRYYLSDCYVGSPKYVVFNFLNRQSQHKKIHLRTEVKIKNAQDRPATAGQLAIEESVAVSVLMPKEIDMLVKQNLIQLSGDSNYDYEMDEDQSLWTISGMVHTLVLRVICLLPSPSLLTEANLLGFYQLNLSLLNEYNEEVQTYHTKLRLRQPVVQHNLYIHGYSGSSSQLQLCFDEGVGKKVLSNVPGLAYRWNEKCSILSIKLEHKGVGEKSYFLMVNDSNHLFQLGSYKLNVFSYPLLAPPLFLALGQVRKLSLEFALDQKVLTVKQAESNLKPSSTNKDQVRVLFACSKPEHCFVRCQGQSELICKTNKIYEVQLRIQSFDNSLNPERILVHAIDLTTSKILKRWLLQIQKQTEVVYKQILRLVCEHGKPLRYKFQLVNDEFKDRSFRLYSSNLSILGVSETVLPLIGNQKVNVELQFIVKQELSNEDLLQPISVVLTVSDGVVFTNYLFELSVRIR